MWPMETGSTETSTTPAGNLATAATWTAVGLVALFYLCLKSFSCHWQVGDENIYLYMAWAFQDHGALPYRDYFFAHPPLHLLPGLPLFSLLGVSPLTARLIPVSATLAGALALFLAARRRGRLGAVVTVFLYLTAFSLVRASTHWTGINLSVMWACLGLWALLGGRALAAGVLLALGVGTGNYLLPGAIMAGGLCWLQERRSLRRYLLGFVPVWLAVQLLGLALGGGGYLEAVYLYHVHKPQAPGSAYRMTVRVISDNFTLFLLGALAPLLARLSAGRGAVAPANRVSGKKRSGDTAVPWLERGRLVLGRLLLAGPAGLARLGVLWAAGYLLFIFLLPKVFPFYFLLLFPGLALAGGAGLQCLYNLLGRLWRGRRERDRSWRRQLAWLAGLLVVSLVLSVLRLPLQRTLLPGYVRRHDVAMRWSDGLLPGWLNSLFRALWWEDRARAYQEYAKVTELLFHESRYFEAAERLADYVRRHTGPADTIFGDSSTAGLVALLAGRRLADDCADTNTMRFRSGTTRPTELIARIDGPQLKLVLAAGTLRRGRQGRERLRLGKFASLPEFRRWLAEKFQPRYRVRDRTKGWFFLLGRK